MYGRAARSAAEAKRDGNRADGAKQEFVQGEPQPRLMEPLTVGVDPDAIKQKGRREAGLFGNSFAESGDQYFAMTGPPQR